MRKFLWWCAWSSYDEEFKDQIEKIRGSIRRCCKDILKYPPKAWCRAYLGARKRNIKLMATKGKGKRVALDDEDLL